MILPATALPLAFDTGNCAQYASAYSRTMFATTSRRGCSCARAFAAVCLRYDFRYSSAAGPVAVSDPSKNAPRNAAWSSDSLDWKLGLLHPFLAEIELTKLLYNQPQEVRGCCGCGPHVLGH